MTRALAARPTPQVALFAALAALAGALAAVQPVAAVALAAAAALVVLAVAAATALPAALAAALVADSLAREHGWSDARLAGVAAASFLAFAIVAARRVRLGASLLAGAVLLGWTLLAAIWAADADATLAEAGGLAAALACGVGSAMLVRRRATVRTTAAVLVLGALAAAAASLTAQALADEPLQAAGGAIAFTAAGVPLALSLGWRLPAALLALALASSHSWPLLGALAAGGLCAVAGSRRSRDAALLFGAAAAGVALGWLPPLDRAQDLLRRSTGVDWSAAWEAAGAHPAAGGGALAMAAGSTYLDTLAELGAIGLTLLVAALVLAGVSAARAAAFARARRDDELAGLALGLLGAVAALAVLALAVPLGRSPLFWVVIGLAAALPSLARRTVPRGYRGEGPLYDLRVRERLVEQRERRVVQQRLELLEERRRLERRRDALVRREPAVEPRPDEAERLRDALAARELELSVRERQLEERERELGRLERELRSAPAQAPARMRDELEAALEHQSVDVAARSAALVAREREVAERESGIATQLAGLAARERELLDAEIGRAARELALSAPPSDEPARRPVFTLGRYNVAALARAVEDNAERFPEQAEEWRLYLQSLWDYAGPGGELAPEFDPLVEETFSDLL